MIALPTHVKQARLEAFWTKAPPEQPIIAKMTCALNADAGKAVHKPPDACGGASVRGGI